MPASKQIITSLADKAGITINGSNPYDIVVRDERFYDRVMQSGTLGLGESYMDGWWDAAALDETFYRILRADAEQAIGRRVRFLPAYLKANILNLQSKERAFHIGEFHYDLGNDFYRMMLDKRLTYTCGYWKDSKTLDEAQEAKLELTCQKLKLEPGMRVLDIGCGWGSLAKYAAEKYGVHVTGITVSQNQLELGRELCKGLSVELRLQDYRDVKEMYHRIVSLGMFEHVGHKNYRTYMRVASRCLEDDGIFLLHTIGSDHTARMNDPWVHKYIFPNSHIPSLAQIAKSAEDIFIMEDWHNFGAYYDHTLHAWYDNVAAHAGEVKQTYGERFYRMWTYYLLMFSGAFRARRLQLWQIVFSKQGIVGGPARHASPLAGVAGWYNSVR